MSLIRESPQVNRLRVSNNVAWLETFVFTSLIPLFGYLIQSDDPLFLNNTFPWLIFASLMPAMRYGFGHGFASAILLISMITFFWKFEILEIESYPSGLILGLLMITMLVGEFTDMWLRQLGKQDVVNKAQRRRLDEFTRNHQLLKVSHDRLENKLGSSTNSLREALVTLKIKAKHIEGETNVLKKVSFDILAIIADYAFVQSANVFQLDNGKLIKVKPLATLGKFAIMDSYNPIIRKTIETGQLVSVNKAISELEANPLNDINLLAAVPISDIEGYMWGIVVIQEMPFVAFHHENLQLIAVLCGHIGDLISHAEHRYSFGDSESSVFIHFLERTIIDRKQFKIETMLMVLILPEKKQLASSVKAMLLEQMRGLDRAWVQENAVGRLVVFLLMPLTNVVEFNGYKDRISKLLKERVGESLQEMDVDINYRELTGKEVVDNLMNELCGVTDIDWKKIKYANSNST